MKTVGIGVLLRTQDGTFLLQQRDHNAKTTPGRITPFGGGLEDAEDVYVCAKRELFEELTLELQDDDLRDIGVFPSCAQPGISIQMFLVEGVDISLLTLQEGEAIVEMSPEEVLKNEKVTDFTKEVIRTLF